MLKYWIDISNILFELQLRVKIKKEKKSLTIRKNNNNWITYLSIWEYTIRSGLNYLQ